jgi:hypothetical protein
VATQSSGERASSDPVSAVASLIACCATIFVAKSSAIPELTSMYFPAGDGVAEVDLVLGRTVIGAHPESTSVAALLKRHLRGDPDMLLLRRQHRDGARLHLAISGGRHALSEDGLEWCQGDGSGEARTVFRRFVEV